MQDRLTWRLFEVPEEVIEQCGELREEDLVQLEQTAVAAGVEDYHLLEDLEDEAKQEIEDDAEWAMVLDGQRL